MDVFGEPTAREALTEWGYGPDAQLELLCISENATYRVTDPDTGAPAVLRLNRPGYHPRQAIDSELLWTAALRREGVVRTPAARRTRQRSWVAVLGSDPVARHAVMFAFVPGVEPAPGSPGAGLRAIGEIAARLHAHSRCWTPPEGFTRFAWDLTAALGTRGTPARWGDWRAAVDPDQSALLQAAEASVVATLTAYGRGPERFGLIHGDLRAANLLVDDESEPVTVIDFDDCGQSWYGYDVAAAVSFLEHTDELPELVADFLTGYRRLTPFRPADVAALPALIMLRRLQLLAWSASHADTATARSLGPEFAGRSARTAEKYLAGRLLTGVS